MNPQNEHNAKVMYMLGQMDSTLKNIERILAGQNTRLEGTEKDIDELKLFNTTLKTRVGMIASGISLIGVVTWEYIKTRFMS